MMFYILRNSFSPNTASSNRALAYYKAMDGMGVDAKIIVLQPDKKKSRIEDDYKSLKVQYCWSESVSNNKVLRRVRYYLNIFRFVKSLRKGDKVYIYGSLPIIHRLVNKKGIDVYVEVTEHPQIYPLKTRFTGNTLKTAMADCQKLSGLFVISNNLQEFFSSHGVNKDRIHIINMMVDAHRFDNIVKGGEKRYICYCGNGNNKKDKVDELIKVFKSVSEKFQDVSLYIIGPKQQVYKDEQDNVELVRRLGLQDRVVFTGILPASEIPQMLVNAELLALDRPDTLQNRAGFPTKLGEYLLSGTPVVATTIGEIPYFLKDGETALLASPNNSEDFAQKILWALEHPEYAKEIGEKGKQLALASFNAEIETKKLMSVINCVE